MGISAPDRYWACGWRCSGASVSGITEPRGTDRKRLVTYIEIDRCATDAMGS